MGEAPIRKGDSDTLVLGRAPPATEVFYLSWLEIKAQGKARHSRLEDSGFRPKCKEPYMKCRAQGVVKSTNVLNSMSLHLDPMSTCR